MSNINKIRLSGQTYNIQDLNATKTVELTQAEYDALSQKDPNVFYIITDAEAGDLSNYYTKSETDGLLDTKLDVTAYTPTDLSNYYTKSETSGATEISTALASKADTATTYTKTETDNAITAATSTKQDTLVSGTNIKTINNQSILGEGNITIEGGSGGGKAINAGTNISITTGETADTINCTIPYIGEPMYSIKYGYGVTNKSQHSLVIGAFCTTTSSTQNNIVVGYDCHSMEYSNAAFGMGNYSNNRGELSSGYYNVSNSGSTDADKTLFSIGNGTSSSARHNAFEIRQNGDIYITKDGQDVKLQDQLGSGGSSYTAGDGIDINNDVISVTGKVDTSTYETYTAATDTALASKQTTLTAGTGISIVDNVISATGGGGGSITIDQNLDSSSTNPVANSAITNAIYNQTARFVGAASYGYIVKIYSRDEGNAISIAGNRIKTLENSTSQTAVGTWLYTSTINGKKALSSSSSNTKDFSLVETSAITTSISSSSTDTQVPSAKAVYDQLGGIKLVKLTQSEYDSLTTKDNSTLYVIVN